MKPAKGDIFRWKKNRRKYRIEDIYNANNAIPSAGPLYFLSSENGGLFTVQFQVVATDEMLTEQFTRI